jgi:hypothetical protein
LTKGSTQDQAGDFYSQPFAIIYGALSLQIHEETGASVATKGVWFPDRSKATEKDPALYIHISAHTKEILQSAIDKVNELIAIDMGSLVEDKKDRPRERVWPIVCSVNAALYLISVLAEMARRKDPCGS